MSNAAPNLISLKQAASHYNVSTRTIRRWIDIGYLNAIRVGPRLIRIELSDLEELKRPAREMGA